MSIDEKSFGPTALATPANALSAMRLVAAPLFALLIVEIGPVSWLLWALWTLLATTDGLDGHLARRQGATSSGAFLDPLADKFLVLGALGALGAIGTISWLPISLIAFRELSMSVFRFYAGKRAVSIPARPLAKVKTFLQDLAIGLVFIPIVGRSHPGVGRDVLWAAVGLTLVTGIEYFVSGRRLMRARRVDRAGRTDQAVA